MTNIRKLNFNDNFGINITHVKLKILLLQLRFLAQLVEHATLNHGGKGSISSDSCF